MQLEIIFLAESFQVTNHFKSVQENFSKLILITAQCCVKCHCCLIFVFVFCFPKGDYRSVFSLVTNTDLQPVKTLMSLALVCQLCCTYNELLIILVGLHWLQGIRKGCMLCMVVMLHIHPCLTSLIFILLIPA